VKIPPPQGEGGRRAAAAGWGHEFVGWVSATARNQTSSCVSLVELTSFDLSRSIRGRFPQRPVAERFPSFLVPVMFSQRFRPFFGPEDITMENATAKIAEPLAPEVTKGVKPRLTSQEDKAQKKPKRRARKTKRQKREPRTYPGRTLEDCIKVVEAIKTQNAGNPWPPDEIAKAVKIKSRSSNLAEIIRSANLYKLVDGTYRAATISLSELGRKLAYPQNDDELKQARKDALFSVDLFKKVILHYKDGQIPESPFVNNTLTREFKLPAEFHDEFLRILRKNLEYVGGVSGWTSSAAAVPDAPPRGKSNIASLSKTTLRAFVIMPFVEREVGGRSEGFFKEVYASIIKPACERAGFEPHTAERKGSDIIHTTILREILEADIVVADLTDHNPNVMFELGLRMAMGKKPVCIIKSKDTGSIFDVDHVLRVHEYSQNLWASTVEKDIPELAEHITATWDARNTGSGYVEILTGRSGA
jgi:hypothetical protein